MKKTTLIKIFILLLFLFSGTMVILAADYTLLEPGVFGNDLKTINDGANFITYASLIFKALLVIAISLAVLQIVLGGFGYITSATGAGKGDGKKKINDALLGLLIILLSWLVLNAINPDLVHWKLVIPKLG